ncbi:hypothetical protein PCANC_05304 [Puccinia coronata f. sp. avenae]|uniref:Uncharacterized protein n=1 Tax=Puccinia coronata f. sp. avenae TaxID=200324 RepID=A0A2N5VYS7_9BASI|nr:hypothetical protein PCANC_05304 [Puccinia coronata f. sp. avenae]
MSSRAFLGRFLLFLMACGAEPIHDDEDLAMSWISPEAPSLHDLLLPIQTSELQTSQGQTSHYTLPMAVVLTAAVTTSSPDLGRPLLPRDPTSIPRFKERPSILEGRPECSLAHRYKNLPACSAKEASSSASRDESTSHHGVAAGGDVVAPRQAACDGLLSWYKVVPARREAIRRQAGASWYLLAEG